MLWPVMVGGRVRADGSSACRQGFSAPEESASKPAYTHARLTGINQSTVMHEAAGRSSRGQACRQAARAGHPVATLIHPPGRPASTAARDLGFDGFGEEDQAACALGRRLDSARWKYSPSKSRAIVAARGT